MIKDSSKISLITFVFSPFFSFLLACDNLKNKLSGLMFVLFYSFFGFAHSFDDARSDSERIKQAFLSFSETTTYADVWHSYVNGEIKDVYYELLCVFVRSFTSSAHVLLMLVGFIGGIFIYMSLRKMVLYCGNHKTYFFYIVLLLSIVLFNPVSIGGVRNFTASAVFIYFSLIYLLDEKDIGVLGLLLCPFIHYSFFVSVFFVIFIRFFKFRIELLWWMVVFVCVISVFLDTEYWRGLFDVFDIAKHNQAIGYRASSYSSIEVTEEFSSSFTVKLMSIQQYVTRLFVLLVLFRIKNKNILLYMDVFEKNIYYTTLCFLLLGYFFISFSVVGERYLTPGLFLLFLLILKLSLRDENHYFRFMIKNMFLFFFMKIAWVLVNSYFVLDHRIFYMPLPALMF